MKLLIRKILGEVWQAMAIINDTLFRHGCDFSGWATQGELGFSEEKGNQYQPSTDTLKRVLKVLKTTSDDAIIDIGCGKGKAMYLMSKVPFGKIGGFDLSRELVDIANKNFERLDLRNCHAFCADASDFEEYDDYNYFYLANSVPEKVFEMMIGHINASIKRNPRQCTFIMMNPHYEDYLIEHTDFRLLYTKKSFISWFSYRCYRTELEGEK